MSSARQPTVFDHMQFAPYEFREFPKAVSKDGKQIIVNDAEEEAAVTGGGALVRGEDERARLVKLAEVSGVQIDKRWGLDRIRSCLTAQGVDHTTDPDS